MLGLGGHRRSASFHGGAVIHGIFSLSLGWEVGRGGRWRWVNGFSLFPLMHSCRYRADGGSCRTSRGEGSRWRLRKLRLPSREAVRRGADLVTVVGEPCVRFAAPPEDAES
jgi:hypothetical protein